ncbi:uncharacterized protein LOC106071435 isoform X2 [Biomphalaria glabrata]|uniref:Uncharacterized protein LOC106071435 isoform X2 n=1 Tax=Biomphalaria glabrata TaxID=6526 RepID=A0A2C9M3H6_BIOGL|nr:uncharacterized protein LOC106071435 isoform X2 [Biomphalaria glabrata]
MNRCEKEEFALYTPKGYGLATQCPDGIRDYRPHLVEDTHVIGIGETSPLFSSDTSYLFRPAPGATSQKPRCALPGEIGWGVPWLVDWAPPRTGQQIVLGDFRQLAEDKKTHEFIGAWFPGPKEMDPTLPRSASSGRPCLSSKSKHSALVLEEARRQTESEDSSSHRINIDGQVFTKNWASTDFRYPQIDSLRMRTFESIQPRVFQKYC